MAGFALIQLGFELGVLAALCGKARMERFVAFSGSHLLGFDVLQLLANFTLGCRQRLAAFAFVC